MNFCISRNDKQIAQRVESYIIESSFTQYSLQTYFDIIFELFTSISGSCLVPLVKEWQDHSSICWQIPDRYRDTES